MDIVKAKWKKNLMIKAWKRCSLPRENSKGLTHNVSLTKSNSWHCSTTTTPPNEKRKKKKGQVAPDGCFSVYVGPEKQRFVVKTELANHPLFKMLLEDAEMEYGYNNEGPILLPCDVDLFYKILAEMESKEDMITTPNRGFAKGYGLMVLCRSVRRPISGINNGYGGAYRLLSPSRMLKMN